MQRYFHVDLCDVWRGTITLRKVVVLIAGLPPDCATAYALGGVDGPMSGWTLTNALLGRLTDDLAALRWEWGFAHIADDKRGSYPDPPRSVLPKVATDEPDPADIPLVSPHRLGEFMDND